MHISRGETGAKRVPPRHVCFLSLLKAEYEFEYLWLWFMLLFFVCAAVLLPYARRLRTARLFALRRYIYFAGGGHAGQPRHGHYITRKNNVKPAGTQAQLAYSYAKAAGGGRKAGGCPTGNTVFWLYIRAGGAAQLSRFSS